MVHLFLNRFLYIICTSIVFTIPTLIYSENTSNWFLNNKINLGLDLQGGSYLLLEVESDVLLKEELDWNSPSGAIPNTF